MDLKSIQEKLNNEFKGTERKLVFWYDDNVEFVDEVDSIILNNAKVYNLTSDNIFYTKYFFEMVDKTTNYLVYAPFNKPADRENHLADIVYYSKVFYADKISLVMLDLNIPDKFKEHLNIYPKFFKYNKYIEPFAALNIENYNQEIIDIGILSVLCGIKTPNFDEVLRALIISDEFENNKYIIAFEKMGILSVFWQLCQKYYGYIEEKPTLEKLIITLLITYTAHCFKGELPKAWCNFVSPKKNDVAVFVSNFMNNMLYKDNYIALSEKIGLKIKAKDYMSKYDIESYLDCDTFPVFDELIIEWVIKRLTPEYINAQIILDISNIAERRKKRYYGIKYATEYNCIAFGYLLLESASNIQFNNERIIIDYIKSHCVIDRVYRKFYYHFDKLENNNSFLELRQFIENVFTNAFLSKQAMLWADKLEKYKAISEIPHTKQYDFYRMFVEPSVKKECTVVIISDALRYECASELNTIFNDSVKYTSDIEYMVSCVPSYTRLGMAALLPHKQISISENYDVLVAGQATASTEQRQKIIESYNPASVACLYSDIISLGREDVRKLLAGKELIYIYHNQIDARGDNPSTENEVFAACEETFEEIIKLVKKLTVDKTITNYIITADHGFIYKRDKLDESDKIMQNAEFKMQNAYKHKRFIISDKELDIDGTMSFSMNYILGENSGKYVTVPRGADIFKVSGGGQNYVHGGASLQEIIVPVIKLKTARYKKETGNVEVSLISLSRKITNLITYLDFMQNENVSDILLPVEMRLYFINDAGEKISNENIIYADKKNETPEKRMFREKFAFRNRKYAKSEKYYLVMADDKTDVELGRYEFIVDIAFSDDFGFGV